MPKKYSEANYKTFSLPKDMADEIQKIIKENPKYGFKTPTEFLKHAVRELMFKMEK